METSQPWLWVALVVALLVIIPLAYYAGTLLFRLKQQNQQQQKARAARLDVMTESIQTIALAMTQQQCNLSEGVIRLVHLLESLPVEQPPSVAQSYPAIHELFELVRDLPTHDARKALPKNERMRQDQEREEHESRLETGILKEAQVLTTFEAA